MAIDAETLDETIPQNTQNILRMLNQLLPEDTIAITGKAAWALHGIAPLVKERKRHPKEIDVEQLTPTIAVHVDHDRVSTEQLCTVIKDLTGSSQVTPNKVDKTFRSGEPLYVAGTDFSTPRRVAVVGPEHPQYVRGLFENSDNLESVRDGLPPVISESLATGQHDHEERQNRVHKERKREQAALAEHAREQTESLRESMERFVNTASEMHHRDAGVPQPGSRFTGRGEYRRETATPEDLTLLVEAIAKMSATQNPEAAHTARQLAEQLRQGSTQRKITSSPRPEQPRH